MMAKTKKISKDPFMLLRLGLGIVFVLAGIHRIIFFSMAYKNFLDVGLRPAAPLVVMTIIVEFAAGISLVINRFARQACIGLALLLTGGIIAASIRAGNSLIKDFHEVFLLGYTPTDITLHISYLVVLVSMLLFYGRKS